MVTLTLKGAFDGVLADHRGEDLEDGRAPRARRPVGEGDRGQAHVAALLRRPRSQRPGAVRDPRVLRLLRVGDGELQPSRDTGVRREASGAGRRAHDLPRLRRHRRAFLRGESDMAGVTSKRFDAPDESRTPPKTKLDVVDLGGAKAARLTAE